MNLVILTTAITRGTFHEKSIGKFYNLYNNHLMNYNIYHIINLDLPKKLSNTFTKKESLDVFKRIIPSNVNTIIIDNTNPGFLNAYKNVVKKAIELNLNNDETLYWWFEDDWDTEKFNKDLFKIINLFPMNVPVAFNSVISSPLGSFRSGPIMTGIYFKKYFDIVTNNVVNNTCDPERQVSRWISGIKRKNGKKMIERPILNDNTINIIFFYYNTSKINTNDFPNWWYERKDKYNSDLTFKYHAIKTNNLIDFEYGLVNLNEKSITFKKTNIKNIFDLLKILKE